MNRRVSGLMLVAALSLWTAAGVAAQQQATAPDLARLAEGKGLHVFNRSVSGVSAGARHGLRLSAQPGDGIAYVEGVEFANGTIEFDVRGKDVLQQSFVGIAFHGVDGTTLSLIHI